MKLSTTLVALTLVVVPTTAVLAATAAGSTTVARYSFDGGVAAGGTIAELSGRGVPLKVRSAAGGTVRLVAHGTGRALAFPARCPIGTTTTTCPRAILEGGDDADLDPGSRSFRYGAWLKATAAQVGAAANVMQKGVATADSQWKLQISGTGRAQCVVVGKGSTRIYLAKSDIAVTNGAWHQVTCQRISTGLHVFVDGKARGSVAVPSTAVIDNALPLRLGARNLNDLSDQYGGLIDDVYFTLD
ncbi:MAG TPA: LamG-like jellyroll fold domain-containing protein [Catenuloplanes sp.]|jgi:hypothetical protein